MGRCCEYIPQWSRKWCYIIPSTSSNIDPLWDNIVSSAGTDAIAFLSSVWSSNFVFIYRLACAQLYDWKCFFKPGMHHFAVPSVFPDTWGPGRPHGWLGSCVVRKPCSIWPRSSPQCRRSSLSWHRAGWQRFAYSFMSCSHYVAKIRGVNHARYKIYHFSYLA